jgi:FAD/FMN-containing dehydrogenase
VYASEAEHADLFWALRGGGGNFGVVTAFDFAAHRSGTVFHGKIAFPAAETAAVLAGWAAYLRSAPDELTSIVTLANPMAGGAAAPIEVQVTVDDIDLGRAAAALDPIRRLGTVLDDDVVPMPYPDTLVEGAVPPPGLRFLVRSAYVDRESVPDAVGVLAEAATLPGSPTMQVRSLCGAVARVPDEATAYAHRQAELLVVTMTAGTTAVVEAARPRLDALWARLTPHVHGAYANFLSGTGEAELAAIYPRRTRDRLAEVKRRYDPENLLSGNHNIRPA